MSPLDLGRKLARGRPCFQAMQYAEALHTAAQRRFVFLKDSCPGLLIAEGLKPAMHMDWFLKPLLQGCDCQPGATCSWVVLTSLWRRLRDGELPNIMARLA